MNCVSLSASAAMVIFAICNCIPPFGLGVIRMVPRAPLEIVTPAITIDANVKTTANVRLFLGGCFLNL